MFVERVPRPELVTLFRPGGALAGVTERVVASAGLLDLDFWVDGRAGLERASAYVGLAKVLDVHADPVRGLRLEVAGLVRRRLALAPERSAWTRESGHEAIADQALDLLERALPVLPESHVLGGAILRARPGRTVLARSFGPRFDDEARGAAWVAALTEQLRDALRGVPGIPANLTPKASCDALVLDEGGRPILVDAEVPRSAEIGFAPARAVQNLALWDAWTRTDPDAGAHLRALADVRESLGLSAAGTSGRVPTDPSASTFVLVTGSSVSSALVERLERATVELGERGLLDPARFRFERAPLPAG